MRITLLELEQRFRLSRTLDELNKHLAAYLGGLTINTYSFTYYSYYPNSLHKLKYDFSSSNFAVWHKHYIEENYEEIDSTMEDVYRSSLPRYWDLQQQLKEAATPREKQMRLDSIEFGAEKGLSIPIHGPQEDFAIMLVVQMRGEHGLDNWQQTQYELFTAAYYYYSYLQPLLLKIQQPVDKYQLNQREVQCLQLVAKRYTVAAIAKALNITERTVNYHIQRCNKKLGTKNKYQSVAKALSEGLIRM